MSILYNKTAIKYWYTRNDYGVSKFDTSWVSFACNVQPIQVSQWYNGTWFDDATVYKLKNLYCDYSWIVVGDKIDVDWVIYIVKSVQKRDWTLRKFYKVTISESEWT